jgi:hypothetical protein
MKGIKFDKNYTMTVANLKKDILIKIESLEDAFLLEEIHRMLHDALPSGKHYVLTGEQENALNDIAVDIDKGEYVTHRQSENDLDQWLK